MVKSYPHLKMVPLKFEDRVQSFWVEFETICAYEDVGWQARKSVHRMMGIGEPVK